MEQRKNKIEVALALPESARTFSSVLNTFKKEDIEVKVEDNTVKLAVFADSAQELLKSGHTLINYAQFVLNTITNLKKLGKDMGPE